MRPYDSLMRARCVSSTGARPLLSSMLGDFLGPLTHVTAGNNISKTDIRPNVDERRNCIRPPLEPSGSALNFEREPAAPAPPSKSNTRGVHENLLENGRSCSAICSVCRQRES